MGTSAILRKCSKASAAELRPVDPIRAELWRSGEEFAHAADYLGRRTACLVRDGVGFGLPDGADDDWGIHLDRLKDIAVDVSRSGPHHGCAVRVVPLPQRVKGVRLDPKGSHPHEH